MAGYDRLKSRIDKLYKRVIPPVRKISVIFMNRDGVTDRPNGAGDDRVNGARRTW